MLKGLFAGCAALALGGAIALGATCAPACASAERVGTTESVACGTRYVDADGDGACDNRGVCDGTCAGGALACSEHAHHGASNGAAARTHHGGHHSAHRCW